MEYYDVYENINTTNSTAGFTSNQTIPIIAAMLVFPIDSYPINDIFINETKDELAAAQIYIGGGSAIQSWPGGEVQFSQDDENFIVGEALNNSVTYGTIVATTNPLYDVNDFRFIDRRNSISVTFANTPVTSNVSLTEVLKGGKNLLWIENDGAGELIWYQSVSVSNNVYTFSNLLRGRYNSEIEIANHPVSSIGRKVVLVNTNTFKSVSMPYGIYDVSYYYKGVTTGANPQLVNSEEGYYAAKWNDTVPVKSLNTSVSGNDLLITWIPIDKYPSARVLGSISTTYLYKLEFLDIDNNIIRIIEDITVNNYTYTEASLLIDSIDLSLNTFKIRIYKKSDMKGYDVSYGEFIYTPSTVLNSIEDITSSVKFLYNFNSTANIFEDQVSSNNLYLDTVGDVYPGRKLRGILSSNRSSGSLLFTKGNRWKSTNTPTLSSTNFSFMIIFKTFKNTTDIEQSWYTFLTRTGGGLFGQHEYEIEIDNGFDGTVKFHSDLSSVEIGNTGSTFMIIVTVDNETALQRERIYLNGSTLVNDTSSSLALSSWSGELLFGDTKLNANTKTWSKIQIETMAYWDYKLSNIEISRLSDLYNIKGGLLHG